MNYEDVLSQVSKEPITISTLGQMAGCFIRLEKDNLGRLSLINANSKAYPASKNDWENVLNRIKNLDPLLRSMTSSYTYGQRPNSWNNAPVNTRMAPYLAGVILYFNEGIERNPQTPILLYQ